MLLIVLFASLLFAAALGLIFRRGSDTVPVPANLVVADIADRYRPMARLLNDEDFEVLNATGDRKLLRRIRSQRRTIFRGYLRSLRRDHAMLCAHVRCLMVQSVSDRGDLASALLKNQLAFECTLAGVHTRLAMHALGVGTVDVSSVLGSFEQLRYQIDILRAPAAMSAAA